MKILCIIDHFGSGGAQRQIVNLACGLKSKGHQVEMFIYYPEYDFFNHEISQAGIRVHSVKKGRGFSLKLLWILTCLLRREKYDGAISFLSTPNIYAEISCILNKRTKLIVSERSSHLGEKTILVPFLKRLFHALADVVVSNSHSHSTWLRRYPWLKNKVRTIYNGYLLPQDNPLKTEKINKLSLLAVGRVVPGKNVLSLVEALIIYYRKHKHVPLVSWVGKKDSQGLGRDYCQKVDELLIKNPTIQSHWVWLGERSDIPELLERNYALIHPSLYEGLPNVVCESLIAGRPVLASNVCDHPLLVKDGLSGFLFDPKDPLSIAHAIERLANLSHCHWQNMAENARLYAEKNLDIFRMVDSYENLLNKYTNN